MTKTQAVELLQLFPYFCVQDWSRTKGSTKKQSLLILDIDSRSAVLWRRATNKLSGRRQILHRIQRRRTWTE